MGLILDTNVFILAERSSVPIDFGRWTHFGDAFISAITASELLVGVHRANTPERRATRAAFVEAILSRIPALPFTVETARTHAEIFAELTKNGAAVGAHDLLIAATALTYGYPVLTGNFAEFARVPGLRVINPHEQPTQGIP